MKYFFLFITIFLAVYLANLASHFTQAYLWVDALTHVSIRDNPKASSSAMSKSEFFNPSAPAVRNSKPLTSVAPPVDKQLQQAIENDLKLCNFWSAAYAKDRLDSSKAHKEQACNRYQRNIKKRGLSP
ncbi:hypothetical protein [Rheinheimera sp.]|uniref:hypothetical protein n=1 Tax=Rheinheimera sp. TaxID=1869214 RepID=UPI0040484787